MKVLIAGHWDGPGVQPIAAWRALGDLATGFRRQRPTWSVDCVPFGPGHAARDAIAAATDRSFAPILVDSLASARGAAYIVREAWEAGLTPVLEGGHIDEVDAGLGFLEELTGVDLGTVAASLAGPGAPAQGEEEFLNAFARAIEAGRALAGSKDIIAASSTMRPLLGLSSTMAIAVDLKARDHQDRHVTALLHRAFAHVGTGRVNLGVDAVSNPALMPGSGASGGVAAIIAGLGGRIVETGDLLVDVTQLRARTADADLVIVVEPMLHSPHLAEALMDSVTNVAAEHALPVVAVGAESSLSAHEAAQRGVHGVLTDHSRDPLESLGERVARTWAPH